LVFSTERKQARPTNKTSHRPNLASSSSPVSAADCTSLAEWRPTSARGEGGGGGVRRSRGSMERRAGRGFSEVLLPSIHRRLHLLGRMAAHLRRG